MTYFLYKLISPRTTFPQDITRMEMKVMQNHVVYWKELTDKKIVLLFRPVADPKGTYGLAIIEADDEDVVNEYGIHDPAIEADVGFKFEIYPMPQVILRDS
jgi:uncharacterized protein YciI